MEVLRAQQNNRPTASLSNPSARRLAVGGLFSLPSMRFFAFLLPLLFASPAFGQCGFSLKPPVCEIDGVDRSGCFSLSIPVSTIKLKNDEMVLFFQLSSSPEELRDGGFGSYLTMPLVDARFVPQAEGVWRLYKPDGYYIDFHLDSRKEEGEVLLKSTHGWLAKVHGRKTNISAPCGYSALFFDGKPRSQVSGNTKIDWSYDSAGRLSSVACNGIRVLSFSRNTSGRLVKINIQGRELDLGYSAIKIAGRETTVLTSLGTSGGVINFLYTESAGRVKLNFPSRSLLFAHESQAHSAEWQASDGKLVELDGWQYSVTDFHGGTLIQRKDKDGDAEAFGESKDRSIKYQRHLSGARYTTEYIVKDNGARLLRSSKGFDAYGVEKNYAVIRDENLETVYVIDEYGQRIDRLKDKNGKTLHVGRGHDAAGLAKVATDMRRIYPAYGNPESYRPEHLAEARTVCLLLVSNAHVCNAELARKFANEYFDSPLVSKSSVSSERNKILRLIDTRDSSK